jgi:cytochrome c
MKVGSGAKKYLAYIALAYTLAQTAAFGADLSTPGADATPAQALLARAVDAVRADPSKALDAFNAFCGPYAEDDLYVFVIDTSSKHVRANGADPRLIGIETDALSLRAPGGKLIQEMIAAAGQRDQAEMDYAWPNPVTGNVENRHVFAAQSRRHGCWRCLLRAMNK